MKCDMLQSVDFSSDCIRKKLEKLNPDKAPGADNIYPVVLKNLASSLSYPLSVIFTKSFEDGVVPKDWKLANVTALFKKGPKDQVNNYRPVSLTSQICKVMESLIRDSVMEHMIKHSLISKSQHGFTKGRSCLTNRLSFLEKATQGLDQGYPIDVLYLDFSKAFDKVPHSRLISKIRAHGIGNKICNWIQSWLRGRMQRVVVKGCQSSWLPVESGVPQGSVLGPTLFVIFINDISNGIVSPILTFADDTKLFSCVDTPLKVHQVQLDLEIMYKWTIEWQMLFNIEKCKCLHLGYNNPLHTYSIGAINVKNDTTEKDLGVMINNTLSISEQVAKVVTTANKILGIIYRTYDDKSLCNIVSLYKSLVRPHLEYCIQAWKPFLQKDIDKMENVQRRATRMITEIKHFSYQQRLFKTGLMSLETRRIRADLIEVWKILHGFEGLIPEDFFILSSTTATSTRTRGHSLRIYKPYSRLDIRKYFFSQRIIEDWNYLPAEVVESGTLNTFKSKLEPYLKKIGGLYMSRRRLPGPVFLRPSME